MSMNPTLAINQTHPFNIGRLLLSYLLLVVCVFPAWADNPSANRPNIVFIMTDDQGYWDTGATGNPHIDTPNMDSLSSSGAKLNRYYAAPVCAPTRAGVMTGRYYLRTGLYNTRFGGDSLGRQEITIAQLLKQAGYRTGLFGKWHLGKYNGYQPQERGFDEFFGHYHGHLERYHFPDQVVHNGQPVEARGYVTDIFTDASIDFIDHAVEQNQQPFFCCLMYNAPHSPFLLDTSHYGQPKGDELLDKYLKRGLPIKEARIYSLVERIDQNLGRLLTSIDQQGIANNTLIVFTSDNGGVSKFWKGGMNGNKASAYEGGVRAPCFVRWPERIQPGHQIDSQTSHVDWLPTFCELAGIEPPTDRPIDGISLVNQLTTVSNQSHHRYVYHTWDRYQPNPDRRWSISDDSWKLMCQVGSTVQPTAANWRLYNLDNDPGEKKNLANRYPEEVARLRKEFVRWFDEVTEGHSYKPIAIPVGQQSVEIEPSWATWKGESIQYVFDGYDWDTIEGWKQPGESATWNLNVERPGDFHLILTYGCRPTDAGGVLTLATNEQTIDHQVQASATADQFDTHTIGVISLQKGQQTFTAKVKQCPGKELMRLNKIVLIPVSDTK